MTPFRPTLILAACAAAASLAGCRSADVASASNPPPTAAASSNASAAGASSASPSDAPLPTSLEEAVANPLRKSENRARDVYRHPLETLRFFQVTPEKTVVEITPGRGWYAEILAPLLASKGQYVAAVQPAGENQYLRSMIADFNEFLRSHPAFGSKAQVVTFDLASDTPIQPAVQADVVVTFRNVHNWMSQKQEEKSFKAFFAALKPGGVLGVVEHRAPAKGPWDSKTGYVRTADVIRLAKSAGFRLEATSEINANPKDTKDHPEGVWTLPPTYRLGEKDREKYAAIGESDRMTLRFRKPKR